MSEQQLSRIDPQTQAIQQDQAGREMLLKGVAMGAMNPEAAKAAVDLYERLEAKDAAKAFAAAFSQLQAEIPKIIATKVIKGNDGTVRSAWAPYEEIKKQLTPILAKYGFSVGWDAESDDKRITAICKVKHSSGHIETSKFSVRLSAPPGTSAAQADGSTLSYAKRYALCNAFDIAVSHDDDARMEGDFITPKQAKELEAMLLPEEKPSILRMAGAEKFTEIRTGHYPVLLNVIAMKRESKKPTKKEAEPAPQPTKAPTTEHTPDSASPNPSSPSPTSAEGSQPTTPPASGKKAKRQDCQLCGAPMENGKCPNEKNHGKAGEAAQPVEAGAGDVPVQTNAAAPAAEDFPDEMPGDDAEKPQEPHPNEVAAITFSESPMPTILKYLKGMNPATMEQAKARMKFTGALSKAPESVLRRAAFFCKLIELEAAKQ